MNTFTVFAALLLLSWEISAHSHDSYTSQPHPNLPASEGYNSPSLPSHAVVPTHNLTPLRGSNSQVSNGSNGYLEPVFSGHATPQPDSALHGGANSGAYAKSGATTVRPVHPNTSLPEEGTMVPGAVDTKYGSALHSGGEPKQAGAMPDYIPTFQPFGGRQSAPVSPGYLAPSPKRNLIAARTSRCFIPNRCRAPVHCVSPASCRTLAKYCWKKASRCGYTY
ncbi:uncharacterized protein PGTG_15238 [Puccinia graminis f. sp. tritici CRL 75-36-700-3]|uniref:Uncharacterized protein n=1 Tax=Puccinia graminis f. sp. tritici (strain CRL 75-36-700-3 / race SCCL) TaxID=418459 RepID=E3KYX1_PUCGT|nr:uncharacterized protein PGTG_15238 [Puccinia graminis f. sp. tritici CRL 75-36-700-3]EFP89396.1 hypothetical protein PGTG_15238 [Puccinia graminis f. sp. tritici CRL 75-36-700-3]